MGRYLDRDAFAISAAPGVDAMIFEVELLDPELVDTLLVDSTDLSLSGVRGGGFAQDPRPLSLMSARVDAATSYLF